MNHPTPPDDQWESAMSRDFEARVRNLHESPLDMDQVRSRAGKVRRNRRVAVAGGVAAVVAVVAPIAITIGNNTPTDSIQPAGPGGSSVEELEVDYLVGDVWHQSDGDAPRLPTTYVDGVLWDDLLVAQRAELGPEATTVVDVIDAAGKRIDSFATNGKPVAVDDDHTTIAYVTPAGEVTTRWGDQVGALKQDVPDSEVAGLTGGPACGYGDDCTAYVNQPEPAGCQLAGEGTMVQPAPVRCRDATDNLMSVVYDQEETRACTGLRDRETGAYRWQTCDPAKPDDPGWNATDISPNEKYVAAVPGDTEGLGANRIAMLKVDASTPEVVASYDRGTVLDWGWSQDGEALIFTSYADDRTYLMALRPDGTLDELTPGMSGPPEEAPLGIIR